MKNQIKVNYGNNLFLNRKWTWVGHISRRTGNRWSASLTVWTPVGGKRNRVRQRKGGEINYNSTGAM